METENPSAYHFEEGTATPFPEESEPTVTSKTWLVVYLLSQGYGLSFIPVPAMAAIGSNVAAKFGDEAKSNWFVATWSVAITIMFMIVGPNTDLLGRRWFIVAGNLICTLGHLLVGCATSNTMIIAGLAITGIGAANAQLAAYALPELLPNKWRHIGVVIADGFVFFVITVFPVTARYGFEVGSWRANFWAAGAAQFLSFVGLLIFYFPPAHPNGLPYTQAFRELDYIGMILFTAGALPMTMGIVWSSSYAGSDPHVVAALVVGGVMLVVFALWETFGKIKHPLAPRYIFTSSWGRDFTAPFVAIAIINMSYFGTSVIWPTMISEFYTDSSDWKRAVVLSLPQGLAVTAGGVLLSVIGSKIRQWHHQQSVAVFIMVVFGGLLALGNPSNLGMMIAFLVISLIAMGYAIYLAIAIAQMGVDQQNLGTAGGLAGTARFAGGLIADAVYLAVLNGQVAKYTTKYVPAAAEAAGLAADQVSNLMKLLGTTELETTYNTAIVNAVENAVRNAEKKGLQAVAYTSVAFGAIGFLASLWCKDVDPKMTNKIEVYLENSENADKNKYH